MPLPDEDMSGYIASLISGDDDAPGTPQPMHAMSLRIPIDLASFLIVMAEHSDKSRNEMARMLMQAGVDAVLARLPAELSQDVREGALERFQEMLAEV